MRKNSEQPISLKFIVFIFVIFMISVIYISIPNNMKEIKNKKTFEELLEYRSNRITEQKIPSAKIKNNNLKNQTPPEEIKESKEIYEQTNLPQQKISYDELLDNLAEFPAKNKNTVTNILNQLLLYKGYPENIIKVTSSIENEHNTSVQNSYIAASFDIKTGILTVSEKTLYSINTKVLIAILVHELDHFDKISQICRAMGINNFKEFFEENNIYDVNTIFWSKAFLYANTENFDIAQYKNALQRLIEKNNINNSSSYSDFYKLSEDIRNPLEVSAYNASDYVYKHYNIEEIQGPLKTISQKFNDIDWAIYNMINKDELLKDKRAAFFDYFFIKAVLNLYPDFQEQFNICLNEKDGDLTSFWIAFKNSESSFYKEKPADIQSYNKIIKLLDRTDTEIKNGITPREIEKVLRYEIDTLLGNLTTTSSITNLRKYILNYLNYLKRENINAPKEELKCLLTLICIENELYTDNRNKISLYYLKIPPELVPLYNIDLKNKRQKYHFIYNNEEFKNKLKDFDMEATLLTELLENSRLNLKKQ